MTTFRNLMSNVRGASAIEYALIASLISIAAVSAFANVGHGVNARFTTVQAKVSNTL